MTMIGPQEKAVLDALVAAPRKRMTFDELATKLGIDGPKRPQLLGTLRFLNRMSQIARIGLDTWAIPERTP